MPEKTCESAMKREKKRTRDEWTGKEAEDMNYEGKKRSHPLQHCFRPEDLLWLSVPYQQH
jgi:hypothetical protein